MAYQRVNMVADRFMAEFCLMEHGNFQDWIEDQAKLPFDRKVIVHRIVNVPITKEDWEFNGSDAERDAHVTQRYKPKPDPEFLRAEWVVTGYASYIDTYDTASGDLEPGQIWEGERERLDENTKARRSVPIVKWVNEEGQLQEARPTEVTVTRAGETITKIERKGTDTKGTDKRGAAR